MSEAAVPSEVDSTCTVTGNKRLSRILIEHYNLARLQSGLQAWPATDILPWPAWLRRCYTQLQSCDDVPRLRLLSDLQEQVLWENLVRQNSGADSPRLILQPAAAAGLARKAQVLLDRWGLDLNSLAPGGGQEVTLFLTWARRFQQRCKAGGWIGPSRLEEFLCRGFSRHPECAPARLRLQGFTQLYPRQTRLLQILERAGTRIEQVGAAAIGGQSRRLSFATNDEELLAVAAWCRGLLESGQAGPIGVVVPDLTRRLHPVEDVFQDLLQPDWWRRATPQRGQLFNISLGAPLIDRHLLADALDILELVTGRVTLLQASRILLSEYIAGAVAEGDARARIDVRLRDLGESRWSLRRLISLSANRRATGVSGGARLLAESLARLTQQQQGPRRRPASAWAECFAACLKIMGWPAAGALDSEKFQLLTAFQEQLLELASLDGFCAEMTGAQALGQLQRLLAEQRFQPQSHPAPVQILGLLEASGLQFEQLWITGMQDRQWPVLSEPNPFLPFALQRCEAMPGADPQADLARAEVLTRELLGSAPEVLVSHARSHDDQNCRISPLIEHLPEIDSKALPFAAFSGPITALQTTRLPLEHIADSGPPPLLPGTRARGGSAALQDQSACPFRAVAHRRLGAKGLETIVSPIAARVRGIMAHRLLQHVWDQLRDSKTLAGMDAESLQTLLAAAARRVVAEAARERPQAFAGHMQQLETTRLLQLARDWLEEERRREPFQVMASEQRQMLEIGALSLEMRLDRVDRLAAGGLLLIDYKTGKVSTGKWLKTRPEEPQLPLYCLLFDFPLSQDSPLAGLAFAGLKRGELGFAGIADNAAIAPGLKSFKDRSLKEYKDLIGLIKSWRQNLEVLAREFARGEARVDPRDGPRTCRYCDAGAFCRIADVRRADLARAEFPGAALHDLRQPPKSGLKT